MKTFFVILVTFSLALIIGCQESSINEPNMSTLQKDKIDQERSIKICCQIRDPYSGICNLSGCVTYVHKIISYSRTPLGINQISLRLHMDSKLCDKLGMAHLEWRIEGRSNEIVYVGAEEVLLIEKTYTITNRNDVVLVVRYAITSNGVGISTLRLIPLEM